MKNLLDHLTGGRELHPPARIVERMGAPWILLTDAARITGIPEGHLDGVVMSALRRIWPEITTLGREGEETVWVSAQGLAHVLLLVLQADRAHGTECRCEAVRALPQWMLDHWDLTLSTGQTDLRRLVCELAAVSIDELARREGIAT